MNGTQKREGGSRLRGLLTALMLGGTLAGGGCTAPPVRVVTPLDAPLGESALSLQVTAEPSMLGMISPNKRAAKWLNRRIKNRLIEEGFTLRPSTGDVHVWVHVEEVTTGGSGGEAKCEVRVAGYAEKLPDLSSKRERRDWDVEPRFEWEVKVVRKQMTNGAMRERLAQETQEACAETVVLRLVAAR